MLKNTESGYGLVAIVIHWLMAIAIFFLFGLGLYMVDLTYYDSWYKGSLDLHKSLGLTVFFVYLIRIAWKLSNKKPSPAEGPKWEINLAHWMHLGLYLVMLCLFVTGYLISTADGRSIAVFGLFDVPGFGRFIENQEDIAGEIHEILAFSLIAMVALHALAAMKHQFIDKDGILIRMIKPASERSD
jgi:cytochrome b561